MENTKKKNSFFYGWLIVVGCILIQAVPYSLAANIQPAFTNYVTSGEGFTYTQFSLIFTIGTVVSALCSPFIGKLYSNPKINIKLLYALGVILVGGAFSAMSLAGGNIFAYYALSIFVQIGSAIISAIGVPTLINSWFTENKGIAMGLAFSGGGLGNMVLQQFAGKWLSNPKIGYKGAYLRFGLLAIIVALPVALFIMRFPKSKAELEMNKSKKSKNDSNSKQNSNWGYTFAEVSKIKYFWIFATSFIFVGLYVGGMALQFIPYLQSLEQKQIFTLGSALVASLFGLFSIFGNLCGGFLFDKLGIIKSLVLAGLLVICCGLCLIFVGQINALGFVFSVCLGISMFSYIIGPSYMTGALFGNKEFGTILGIVQIFFAAGFGTGSTLFGLIVDKSGFTSAWISTVIYAIIAYSGLLYSTSSIIKMNKENNVFETKKIS
ncbi:conjugated bile salt MFS transporter [Romboutsia sp. 1001713B170207_170306_H8]|uniref:conjugated bile salt MFS transporter n=1 Tax=Romboutsia sp. 1001713B170207_170306_H8 TaxID=2787112 RepID=UPI000821FC4D|nr:conjugated bile salt MFS transporter [Romboutsia sp. 1001713B170207_170306_H8]SCH87593.1 Oxalate:formate exchange protein [uncultured Clostridium sp.]